MERDQAAPDTADVYERARRHFIDRLVQHGGIRLTPAGSREWSATYDRTLGQFLVRMAEEHPGREVWGSDEVRMLPEFIEQRIDMIAAALRRISGPLGSHQVQGAAREVIDSEETVRSCIAMLEKYEKVFGSRGFTRTPICPEGAADVAAR